MSNSLASLLKRCLFEVNWSIEIKNSICFFNFLIIVRSFYSNCIEIFYYIFNMHPIRLTILLPIFIFIFFHFVVFFIFQKIYIFSGNIFVLFINLSNSIITKKITFFVFLVELIIIDFCVCVCHLYKKYWGFHLFNFKKKNYLGW